MRRLLLFAFVFYSLGYIMRGVVRLYNPGTVLGDLLTDAAMFFGVFIAAWFLAKRLTPTEKG
ncbi:hypothetical protein [Thermococcus sp.]